MKDRAVVMVTTTHTPTRRMLRTTRLAPTIFPTMITVRRVTGHRLIITLLPLTSGDRTFATIHGMTTVGIRRWGTRTGMDMTLIGEWVMAIGGTATGMVDMAIAEGTEGITLRAEHGRLAVRAAVPDSLELEV